MTLWLYRRSYVALGWRFDWLGPAVGLRVFALWIAPDRIRLFGTYVADPIGGYERVVVGLKGFQNDSSLGIPFMLLLPFRAEPTDNADSRSVTEPL